MGQQGWTSVPDAKDAPKQEPNGWTLVQPATAKPAAAASSRFGEEFWKRASPMAWIDSMIEAAKHPFDTAVGMVRSDPAFLTQAKDAAGKGDYATATRKLLSYLSMGLGHELDAQSDMIASGDYKGAAGAMAGMTAQFVTPEIAARGVAAIPKPSTVRVAPRPIPTPEHAAAVQYGQRAGIPIDAATATGSDLVRSVHKKVGDSMGGAGTAERFKAAQSERLAEVGQQLAERSNAAPMSGPLQPGAARPMVPGQAVTAEQAGTLTRNTVQNVVADQGAVADAAYGRLRAIEAKTPIEVDLAPVKAALEPIYRTYALGADIAPLQGSKAAAVRAMARILEGPDVAMASAVDSALSDLKAMQRDVAGTPGAAAANQAVTQVHTALAQAVAKAGPDAVKALTEGRAATTAKYVAQDVLDHALNPEPVRTTTSLTARQDSAISRLRDVAKQAPEAIPQIARAVMDGLMERATADGGFQHAQAVRSQWRKLGDQTKVLLFKDAGYIAEVDNFFRLAEKIAENPNPSGTARINNLFNVASAAVGYPVSKLLYTKAGVRLLTEGIKMPVSTPAARAAWLDKVRKFGVGQGMVTQTARSAATPQG